ncbi:malonate decarboxylase holo-[acyl-carrier-protein] synthase [Actimicrobium sp. CCC2.4]|uniref:malonate decarboxylase holo-[acyl-carrier-protein] synthase n=1 Tax=Actimicrobium sp. CCC2.4 TaxID=3048606 RepID=UPI002AC8CA8C|nr:malonate decarboxylase holo-[acyl-carrier-protein] synthase [Actimicrobium sp. CCC2.4]MEB0136785.1 malonate decarboxylase holo-[acyl-carrier-protein] synthase [Actimicrobium sp. CCC2.4]WPX33936.1 malonate decarboxylase holo-[acyl-carrier-protein] synthase [Actimicrobium sp. CCC2.4]
MLSRHSLLTLSAAGWASARAQVEARHHAAVERWCAADWPVIVRRHEVDCPTGQVCVGLALPPEPESGIKYRLPLRIAINEVTRSRPPLTLAEVRFVLPPAWQAALPAAAMPLAVFGSAALQAITGLPYLRESSDLDILLQPTTPAALADGLALLTQVGTLLPLDGEIVFPSGAAVAWKEWRAASGQGAAMRVLAKHNEGVVLVRVDALLANLTA